MKQDCDVNDVCETINIQDPLVGVYDGGTVSSVIKSTVKANARNVMLTGKIDDGDNFKPVISQVGINEYQTDSPQFLDLENRPSRSEDGYVLYDIDTTMYKKPLL